MALCFPVCYSFTRMSDPPPPVCCSAGWLVLFVFSFPFSSHRSHAAAALLRELSEACSKEGGSQALRSGKLVVETRNATKTASTRYCLHVALYDTSIAWRRTTMQRVNRGCSMTPVRGQPWVWSWVWSSGCTFVYSSKSVFG